MLKMLYPHEYVKSVFSIDYQKVYNKGYKGIIFDIDNTLTHHGEDSTKEIDRLFKKIHKIGIKTILLTDNDEERVKRFIKNIDTLYICDAKKPNVKSYLKAVEMLNLQKDEIIYVGDQIFTDIYGANKSGIANILIKYMRHESEVKIGKKRKIEKIVLCFYKKSKKYQNRIGDICINSSEKCFKKKKRKLFCDLNPTCYMISEKKEILKRHIKNLFGREKFAKTKQDEKLPNVVYKHSSNMIKRAKGVDINLQKNKAINIDLSCKKINGIIINPGEVFSLWKIVGNPSKRKGYKPARIIRWNKLIADIGGGLCNLGNTIHLLILHSPLDVIEFHKHSDALAPDEGKRVPFSAGTSVCYNTLDYRFKNNTNQKVQLCLWCEGEIFHAELRSEQEFPYMYEIIEEEHRFQKEGDKYYRCSKIYRNIIDKQKNNVVEKELVLDNHSEVLYDYALIPKEQIKKY